MSKDANMITIPDFILASVAEVQAARPVIEDKISAGKPGLFENGVSTYAPRIK